MLPIALVNLTGEHVQGIELIMAGAIMTILPVMIVFIALQKYYQWEYGRGLEGIEEGARVL